MYLLKFKLELDVIIECTELITDDEYERYKHVISLLDSENNSYFSSFGDWEISVRGFLRYLGFKKLSDEEYELMKSVMSNSYFGVKIYDKLDKLKESYTPNNSHKHTYVLSKITPEGHNTYYRLYKQFELRSFEYDNQIDRERYSVEDFTINDMDSWRDVYMFNEFTDEKYRGVDCVERFEDVEDLVEFLNENQIIL